MNASASALAREGEVQSEIRKVRTFGRTARVVCAALYGFGLVAVIGMTLVVVLGVIFPGPISSIEFTPEQKGWALPITVAVTGVWLGIVYQLYRLFGNMAAGAIYTPENVRRIRRVGLLSLLLAVLGIALPATSAALVAFGVTVSIKSSLAFSWSESFSAFASAGLVLLVSWIMDVGLYEKDHADALRRDADLVI